MAANPIFCGRIFTLAQEKHTLPDGRRSSFEIIRHPGGAAALPILSDGRIVLLRQFRPAIGSSLWEIPAGRLDPGESPEACAHRELAEEAGYKAGCLEKITEMLPAVGYSDELIHLFLARDLTPVPNAPESDEYIEPVVISLREALAMVRRGEIRDAKTQLALMWVHGFRQEPVRQNEGARPSPS